MLYGSDTTPEQLVHTLQHLNEAYRAGRPLVSDQAYDQAVERLRELDPNNPWLHHTEPGFVGRNRKVKLPVPMKSLNKVKTIKELQNWMSSFNIPGDGLLLFVTPKFDGLSLLHDEVTGQSYSRGGAENEGQDCTRHTSFMDLQRDDTFRYTYGEFVFDCSTWETFFRDQKSKETGEVFKSPRNTAAGLLNRDEPTEALRYVSFYRYGVDDETRRKYKTFAELLRDLNQHFNQKPLGYPVYADDVTDELLCDIFQRWSHEYFIDGLVIYVNDLSLWDKLGRHETSGNPRYAIAYKNPAFTEVFETFVKDVNWKMSKSGAFKPVVNIDTVNTGDCEMENPTGYNAKFIFDNKIGRYAKIKVTRSGGVIPKILEVINPASDEEMASMRKFFTTCPCCGSEVIEAGPELVCTNPDCPDRQFAKIVHFYTTLGAEQMGEETLRKIWNAGYTSLQKMLDITFDELLMIEGFGDSIANTVVNFNSQVRDGVKVTYLMHASDCFQGIGQVKAKKILLEMSDAERFAFIDGKAVVEEGYDQTPEWQNLGKTYQSFFSGIMPFYEFIAKNRLKILPMAESPKATSDKYAGFKVCFTGVRDKELEVAITQGGGEVVSGVSKKTTHLIVADKDGSSSKLTKAKQLGLPILTIEEFKSL